MNYDTFIKEEVKTLENLNILYLKNASTITFKVTQDYLDLTMLGDMFSVDDEVKFHRHFDVEVNNGTYVKKINSAYFNINSVSSDQQVLHSLMIGQLLN